PARHIQRPNQACQQRARPTAFIAAPAAIYRLAERNCDRTQRQRLSLDLDRLTDARMSEELVGNATDGLRLDIADGTRPFGRIVAYMTNETVKRRADLHGTMVGDLI